MPDSIAVKSSESELMAVSLPIEQQDGQFWVDARTLHAALKIGRDFSNWIKGRLEEVDAIAGAEFIVLDGSPKTANGFNPKPRRDYWLSIDLAKEVAMMERSEIGKAIRRYFIQAERKLRELARQNQVVLPDFTDPVAAARAWADEREARQGAEKQIEVLAPKAEQFEALMSTEGTYSVGEAAKLLGTGEGRLFRLLRARGILMDGARSGVEHHNVPYQPYMDRGYFEVITRPRPDNSRLTYTTRVTPKGLAWLQRGLKSMTSLALPAQTVAEA